jgi:hypothetical protein
MMIAMMIIYYTYDIWHSDVEIFFSMAQQPPLVQGLLNIEASRSYSGTPRSVGVISPTLRPLPDNTQHSQQIDINDPDGIQTRNPSKRGAADPRLRRRAHWDRRYRDINQQLFFSVLISCLKSTESSLPISCMYRVFFPANHEYQLEPKAYVSCLTSTPPHFSSTFILSYAEATLKSNGDKTSPEILKEICTTLFSRGCQYQISSKYFL